MERDVTECNEPENAGINKKSDRQVAFLFIRVELPRTAWTRKYPVQFYLHMNEIRVAVVSSNLKSLDGQLHRTNTDRRLMNMLNPYPENRRYFKSSAVTRIASPSIDKNWNKCHAGMRGKSEQGK